MSVLLFLHKIYGATHVCKQLKSREKVSETSASISQVLGLKVCTHMPNYILAFMLFFGPSYM